MWNTTLVHRRYLDFGCCLSWWWSSLSFLVSRVLTVSNIDISDILFHHKCLSVYIRLTTYWAYMWFVIWMNYHVINNFIFEANPFPQTEHWKFRLLACIHIILYMSRSDESYLNCFCWNGTLVIIIHLKIYRQSFSEIHKNISYGIKYRSWPFTCIKKWQLPWLLYLTTFNYIIK